MLAVAHTSKTSLTDMGREFNETYETDQRKILRVLYMFVLFINRELEFRYGETFISAFE
jgi:hypothetical protein